MWEAVRPEWMKRKWREMKQRAGSHAGGWVGEEVGYREIIRYGKEGVKKGWQEEAKKGKKWKKGQTKW